MRAKRATWHRLLIVLPLLIAGLAVVGTSRRGSAQPAPRSPSPTGIPSPQGPSVLAPPHLGPSTAAQSPQPDYGTPRKVYVGVYAFQVPQLDLANSKYLMDFWVWFRWQGDDIDPSKTFALLNQFEAWDAVKEPIYVDAQGTSRPDDLGDGWRYQCFRIQGRFGRSFDIRDYPFDDQQLTIAFEDNDTTVADMVYVADDGTEKVDPGLGVDGWILDHISAKVTEHSYPTNWGDFRRPPGADRYSAFAYTIHLRRPVLGYLATTLVPIMIVMLITIAVFFLGANHLDARIGLSSTCLISAVALQLTAQNDLPKVGYLVLLDHVYNLAYLTILTSLVVTVSAVRLHEGGRGERAHRLDRWGFVGSAVLFFGGTAALILSRV